MNVWSTKNLSFYEITVIESQACKQEDIFIPIKGREDLNKLNSENSHYTRFKFEIL
jgi:hypothetical protein